MWVIICVLLFGFIRLVYKWGIIEGESRTPAATPPVGQNVDDKREILPQLESQIKDKLNRLDEVSRQLVEVETGLAEKGEKASEYAELLGAASVELERLSAERASVESAIKAMRGAQDAWQTEVRLRTAEADEVAFYSLGLKASDVEEVEAVLAVAGRFPKVDLAIRKAVYAVYLREATKEMIGRQEAKGCCGIYKITEVKTGRCYVGQAVDIGDRWTTHVKRALGAEEATGSKLYPAMREKGVWNYSFVVLERVERENLRAREVFWQEFYSAVSFGYSIK